MDRKAAVRWYAKAAEAGAAMIMLMPPYHGAALKADEKGAFEHFARVADAIDIPVMVQDAPLSGVTLSVSFLADMARRLPQVSYFKIEVPAAAESGPIFVIRRSARLSTLKETRTSMGALSAISEWSRARA